MKCYRLVSSQTSPADFTYLWRVSVPGIEWKPVMDVGASGDCVLEGSVHGAQYNGRLLQELGRIMPRIAAALVDAAEAELCSFFVYDERQQRTVGVFRHGYHEEFLPLHTWTNDFSPADIPAEAEVIRTGQPLHRTSREDFERWPMAVPGQEHDEGRLCDLVVPLVWNGRVQGVAYLWRRNDPTPFSEHQIASVLDLAQMAAMAVVFARQYEHERSQRLRVNALLEVADIAASHSGLEDSLPLLAQSIRSASDADVCRLFVVDESGETVLQAINSGITERESPYLPASSHRAVSSLPYEMHAWKTRQPVVIQRPDRELPHDSAIGRLARAHAISELLLAPIVYRDEMIGLVYSWYRDPERSFSPESIAAVQAIAKQAGGVISRARLHEMTEQQQLERESLVRIGQAVLTSDALEPVLDEIASTLQRVVPHDYAFVGLIDEERSVITIERDWGDFPGAMYGTALSIEGSLTGAAVRTGELINVPNLPEDPRAAAIDPTLPILRSVLIAPLTTDTGTLGALFVGREAQGSFTPRQERSMSLLSQQAAVAIQRVQAREALAKREVQQTFLASVGDRLVSADDPRELLPEIARMASGVLADGVLFGRASWEYGVIEWVCAAHTDPEIERRLKQAMASLDLTQIGYRFEDVLLSGRTAVYTPDLLNLRHHDLAELVNQIGVHELALVPLFQPERAKGIMFLLRTDPTSRFQSDDLELARVVATRIGDAMTRYQMNRNREALMRVSETMHGVADLDTLLNVLTRELAAILPFDQLYLGELDEENGVTYPRAFVHHFGLETLDWVMPVDAGICGEALRCRRPIMDNQSDLRPTTHYMIDSERAYYREHGESALATPLVVDEQVRGVLFINRTGRHRFAESDFETFLLFAGLAATAIDRTSLIQHNRLLHRASVEVIAAIVDAKDPTTLEHSRHVAHYSRHIAELMELPPSEVERIELAGLMHDIGKLSIPDEILRKAGALTDDEFELIKTHPDRGARILQQHPALAALVPFVRHHHERYDGRGYPSGLEGLEIPLGASIIAVADAFDTMTSERTYQPRRSADDALRELERTAGTQFQPEVVRRFVESVRVDDSVLRISRQRTYSTRS